MSEAIFCRVICTVAFKLAIADNYVIIPQVVNRETWHIHFTSYWILFLQRWCPKFCMWNYDDVNKEPHHL